MRSGVLPARAAKELRPEELKWTCDSSRFSFETTRDLQPKRGIIGQPQILRSLKTGLDIQGPGYNVFVCGLTGTGRLTTVKSILETIEARCPEPRDRAYANNF